MVAQIIEFPKTQSIRTQAHAAVRGGTIDTRDAGDANGRCIRAARDLAEAARCLARNLSALSTGASGLSAASLTMRDAAGRLQVDAGAVIGGLEGLAAAPRRIG